MQLPIKCFACLKQWSLLCLVALSQQCNFTMVCYFGRWCMCMQLLGSFMSTCRENGELQVLSAHHQSGGVSAKEYV